MHREYSIFNPKCNLTGTKASANIYAELISLSAYESYLYENSTQKSIVTLRIELQHIQAKLRLEHEMNFNAIVRSRQFQHPK